MYMRSLNNPVPESLSFLPFASKCKDSTWRELVIKNTNNRTLDEFQEKAITYMLKKDGWSKNDYSTFKNSVNRLACRELQCCKSSILVALKMKDEDVLKELEKFAELQDFYPYMKRVKDKSSYRIKEESIKPVDAYVLMVDITQKINSYFFKTVKNLLKENDPLFIADFLINTFDGEDESSKDQILLDFDNNFGYLKDFSIFKNIYFKYRNSLFKELLNSLAYCSATAENRYKYGEDFNVFDYVKSKRMIKGE